jgi:hypothetical protein
MGSPSRPRTLAHERLVFLMNAKLSILAVPAAVALFAAPAPSQAAWVQFTDESAARLSGPSNLGLTDPEEKDITTGDVDNDGDTDVVVVRKKPFTTSPPGTGIGARPHVLYLNEGGVMTISTNAYAPDLNTPSDARAAELADVDNDGWLDLVIANSAYDPPRILMNQGSGPSGWLGLDEENFRFPPLPAPPHFCGLGVGDANGDGYDDIYFVDYLNTLEDRLWFNQGSANPGFFTDVTSTNLNSLLAQSSFGTRGLVVDMDGDGDNDLVKSQNGSMQILWNDGTGNFNTVTSPSSNAVYDVGTADLDSDGDLDMYFCQDPQDRVQRNPNGFAAHSAGSWTSTDLTSGQSPFTGGFNANPQFADVDNDGDIDVGVSDCDVDVSGFTRRFSLLRNNANGNPAAPWPGVLASPYGAVAQNYNVFGSYDHAFLDIDGDGFLDLWIGYGTSDTSGGTKVFIQDPPIPPAGTMPFGTGCAGTAGIPQIGTNSDPEIGNANFALTLWSARPSSIAIHFLTLNSGSTPFGPCTVYADVFGSLLLSGSVPTTALGTGTKALPIPNLLSLAGATLYEQWVVLDPLGPVPIAGGLAMTQGLAITFGG